jgi:hypothetical protein
MEALVVAIVQGAALALVQERSVALARGKDQEGQFATFDAVAILGEPMEAPVHTRKYRAMERVCRSRTLPIMISSGRPSWRA